MRESSGWTSTRAETEAAPSYRRCGGKGAERSISDPFDKIKTQATRSSSAFWGKPDLKRLEFKLFATESGFGF